MLQQLAKDVDLLKAQGQADYKMGLRFVFQRFEEVCRLDTSDDSDSIILLQSMIFQVYLV
jgi:hypothetical protein